MGHGVCVVWSLCMRDIRDLCIEIMHCMQNMHRDHIEQHSYTIRGGWSWKRTPHRVDWGCVGGCTLKPMALENDDVIVFLTNLLWYTIDQDHRTCRNIYAGHKHMHDNGSQIENTENMHMITDIELTCTENTWSQIELTCTENTTRTMHKTPEHPWRTQITRTQLSSTKPVAPCMHRIFIYHAVAKHLEHINTNTNMDLYTICGSLLLAADQSGYRIQIKFGKLAV